MKWLPIESAPKDTVIDLWHPEYGRITDQWWDSADGFDWPVSGSTHWMPLPPPPTDEPIPGSDDLEGEE